MDQGFFSPEGQAALTDDVSVLLHHLSALPEPRLDAAFAGVAIGGTNGLLNRPPATTPTKDAFLGQLMEVTGIVARSPAGSGTQGPLKPEQVALLIEARDFLATLARPATVESIRITREYSRAVPLRMIAEGLVRLVGRLAGRTSAGEAAQRRGDRFGRGLAVQVRAWQVFTLALVALTVLLSIYALTGRGLVQEVNLTDARFTALAADMEAAERADAPIFVTFSGVGADGNAAPMTGQYVQRYCEAIRHTAQGERFASRQQQRLCDRYDGYNEALQQLFQRLRYWHSRVPGRFFPIADACPPGQVLRGDLGGCAPKPDPGQAAPRTGEEPAPGLPMAASSPQDASTGASAMALPASSGAGGGIGVAAQRAWVLQQLQHLRLEVVTAQVILQAITEYLLPCLYAMLGALAAVLGNLARKVEDATLSFSDGGVTFRTLVLGLLFGAVIGLFASQVGPAGPDAVAGTIAASLTPAALSLLAGYSVAQVFQFFDGLSLRVFGPRPPAGTPTG